MSLQATVWALKQAPVRDPYAHLVLIGLADHAGDDGRNARPSRTTLAKYARCSTRTVQTKLQELEADGVIRRGDQQQTAHLRPDRRPVVYDLVLSVTLDTVAKAQEQDGVNDVHPVTPATPANGVKEMHPDGVKEMHPVAERGERDDMNGVKRVAHKPYLEPLEYSSSSVSNARPVHPEGNQWRPSERAIVTATDGAPDVNIQTVIAKYRVWCAKRKKTPTSEDWISWVLRDQEAIDKEKALERERQQDPKHWYDVAP